MITRQMTKALFCCSLTQDEALALKVYGMSLGLAWEISKDEMQ